MKITMFLGHPWKGAMLSKVVLRVMGRVMSMRMRVMKRMVMRRRRVIIKMQM
jgi:hypothetical protein